MAVEGIRLGVVGMEAEGSELEVAESGLAVVEENEPAVVESVLAVVVIVVEENELVVVES